MPLGYYRVNLCTINEKADTYLAEDYKYAEVGSAILHSRSAGLEHLMQRPEMETCIQMPGISPIGASDRKR